MRKEADLLMYLARSPNVSSIRFFASKTKLVTKLEAQVKRRANCAVYGCGLSASGSLAIPSLVVNKNIVTAKEALRPMRISYCNLREIKHVAAGFGFSLFASKDKLYGSGLNNRAQIAGHLTEDGNGQDYYISGKRIALPEGKILSISAGRAHSLVATTSGVYAFGENVHAQCAAGHDEEMVVARGEASLRALDLPSTAVKQVHCALDTSFVLMESGEIYSFGLNEDGQCGTGTGQGVVREPQLVQGDVLGERIVWVGGSSDTLLALSEGGDLFLWGQNEYGQGGEHNERHIQLSPARRVCLSSRIVSAGATASAILACRDDGGVVVWGTGLLGLGPDVQRLSRPVLMDQPLFDGKKVSWVSAGNTAMCAVSEAGRVFTWGQNRHGLLGLGGEKDQLFPFQVTLAGDVRSVSMGPDHTLFLTK